MAMVKDNISQTLSDISLICQRLGRNPEDITLVCVTKFATVSMIEEALQSGIAHIGENKVQEALKKYSALKTKVTRHMIGHLQTNKVKDALDIFDVIQSVDSLKLAQELDKQAVKLNKTTDILIQVNTSNEGQKSGVGPDETLSLIEGILKLTHVRILGLMTMAMLTKDEQAIRGCFKELRALKVEADKKFEGAPRFSMQYLSMGMSGDYTIAIEEGANMVRVGTAIFGE